MIFSSSRSQTDPVSFSRWKELQCRRSQGWVGIRTRSLMWFWIKHQICSWRWREMNPLCFGLKILLWNFKSVNFLFFQRIVILPTLKSRDRKSTLREVLKGMPGSCYVCATFQFCSIILNVFLGDNVVSCLRKWLDPPVCTSRPACPTPRFHDRLIYWSVCYSGIFGFASG